MTEPLMTKAEFVLPIGVEVGGTVRRRGVMRRVKNSDIIALQDDVDLKALAKQDLNFETDNPISAIQASGATAKMFAVLFARTVIELEGLTKEQINRGLFAEMYQGDLLYLISVYNKLNETEGSDDKAASSRPLASES